MHKTNYFPAVAWVLMILMLVAGVIVLWPGAS